MKLHYDMLLHERCTSYILHRSDTSPDTEKAYQRLVSKSRINKIGKYIEGNGYFPNSIIVNIETKKIDFKDGGRMIERCNANYGILTLPKLYKSIFIIDGQHRLYGYSKANTESNHTIQVVAFHNLDIEEQTNIFVDINHTQKSVPANLLQSIMANYNRNSMIDKNALSALKTILLEELNSEDDSALYKRIIVSQEKKTDRRCLTLKTLKDWGLNRVSLFGTLKGENLVKTGYLSDIDNVKTLEKAKDFFKECFNYIESNSFDQWELGSADGGFAAMNVSISAFIRLFEDIIDYQVKVDSIKPEFMNGSDLCEVTKPLLKYVTKFINNMSFDDKKKLRSKFGSGATEKVLREYQRVIHENESDFNPEGLTQWIKENSGIYNIPAKALGDKIQLEIREFVFSVLKRQYGEKKWWFDGIPIEIQKKCSNLTIEHKRIEPPENYLLTLDYQTIISSRDNKAFLLSFFTKPGDERVKESKKLSWFVKFNTIRNKYSHPEREKVTEEEYNFLKELEIWLLKKMGNIK